MLTDPFSLALGLLAGIVALAIGWIQFPRPPALDGERWFKLALATVLRGRLEPAGVEAWERAVIRQVLYHPAGRLPERKISNPVAAALPGAALPGELALIAALASRSEPDARVRYLYEEDEAGIDARLADPADLGADYDFGSLRTSWEALAQWGASGDAFLRAARHAVPARWVLLPGRTDRKVGPDVLAALRTLAPDALTLERGPSVVETLEQQLPDPPPRLVLVAEEAAVADLLRILVDHEGLRDQVVAVVSIGGVIGGRTDEEGIHGAAACGDWLGGNFRQVKLDTELLRLTPYFSLQWFQHGVWPPGIPGLPVQASRFPEPDAAGAPLSTVEVVDLGVLPVDRELSAEDVARALFAVVSAWVAARR